MALLLSHLVVLFQLQLLVSTTNKHQCEKGWKQLDDSCLILVNDLLKFNETVKHCQEKYNAQLFHLTPGMLQRKVVTDLLDKQRVWINYDDGTTHNHSYIYDGKKGYAKTNPAMRYKSLCSTALPTKKSATAIKSPVDRGTNIVNTMNATDASIFSFINSNATEPSQRIISGIDNGAQLEKLELEIHDINENVKKLLDRQRDVPRVPRIMDSSPDERKKTVDEGDFIVLKCSASGYPKPTIRWMFNRTLLHVTQSIYNATAYVNSTGVYWCIATNTIGFDKKSFVVTVSYLKPLWVSKKKVVTAQQKRIVLECVGEGYPAPHLEWMKGNQVETGVIRNQSINKEILVLNKTIKSEQDFGIISCTASQSRSGKNLSHAVEIAIGELPKIGQLRTRRLLANRYDFVTMVQSRTADLNVTFQVWSNGTLQANNTLQVLKQKEPVTWTTSLPLGQIHTVIAIAENEFGQNATSITVETPHVCGYGHIILTNKCQRLVSHMGYPNEFLANDTCQIHIQKYRTEGNISIEPVLFEMSIANTTMTCDKYPSRHAYRAIFANRTQIQESSQCLAEADEHTDTFEQNMDKVTINFAHPLKPLIYMDLCVKTL